MPTSILVEQQPHQVWVHKLTLYHDRHEQQQVEERSFHVKVVNGITMCKCKSEIGYLMAEMTFTVRKGTSGGQLITAVVSHLHTWALCPIAPPCTCASSRHLCPAPGSPVRTSGQEVCSLTHSRPRRSRLPILRAALV